MFPRLSRRRFIGVTAAAAGLALVPFGRAARAEAHLVTWRGQAMGAVATLQVHHHDRAAAERLVERSLAEVRRLEAVFSLYREDTALVALNRQGILVAPPADLVAVLAECRRCWELTGGAFDPTVQALWILYRDHFSRSDADPQGPTEHELRHALERVGFGRVIFDANRIALPRRGMGLTLNGIAQGYVTDRVVGILRAGGIASSLVDMGEPRAVGSRPSGGPWRVGIADPDDPEPDRPDVGSGRSGCRDFRGLWLPLRPGGALQPSSGPSDGYVGPPVPQRDHRDGRRDDGRCPLDGLQPDARRGDRPDTPATRRGAGPPDDGDGGGHRPQS